MGISQPTKNLQNALISQGFRHFPSYVSTAISLPISSFIGRILFPWGVSFLIPIFVIAIVKEKEDRIAVMMKMNGLKPSTYYVTQYIQFLVLAILSLLAFLIIGIVLRVDFFRNTSKAVLIILFFIWANVQVSLAFFFSSFFSKNRTALIMTFLIVLCSVVVSLTLDQLYTDSLTPAFFIWPPFAFYRCLSKINTASWRRTLRPYEVSNLAPPDEVGVAVIFMVLEIPVYLLLGAYLSQVLPSEFGVRRPFWFPVTDLLKLLRKSPAGSTDLSDSNIAKAKQAADEPLALTRNPSTHVVAIPEEDDDVREERARVIEGRFDTSATPLYMRGMRKVYEGRLGLGPKVAVNNITVAVEEGRVFGLLGPNGAGKTTLISILTGIYPPTSGEAVIAGYNIRTNMPDVYRNIGVCPQHDILWDDLTVEEHLLFYARLKGVPPNEESAAVAASMKTVALENFATRLSKGLSGGEKRRLSIAIALVGNPACVFLDEPTTGLDPEVRRNIWTIIEKAREGKTIILTTHSMEEAEVLCQRIAIMAKGNMRCLGSVLRLKQLYGSGYVLHEEIHSDYNLSDITIYIESLLPSGNFERIDSFQTSAAYEFKPSAGLVGQLFEILQKDSKANGITDWGLSQTSLEEVFLQIIS
ncbi:P-loop containing nucleoside triphosphate hydrolase protein [Gonapodya prolifera JEL478]|uniref:p-loop containing nucleoside triphosphate hydrolase protein n=1 Tax=Gonapodya prolifera (strain JEL478) TaxID=1344416 RepID=A0A139A5Y2_GONPJ|nr:P-loop containing nucleoside triphosphate hydrolase protein [Gonapodya prolifera JEL478]|eukprot:KXS12068.1 P-loop containing nucleoside triphosphate hydrolase protein [Gonapodya prolifera JEL478]